MALESANIPIPNEIIMPLSRLAAGARGGTGLGRGAPGRLLRRAGRLGLATGGYYLGANWERLRIAML